MKSSHFKKSILTSILCIALFACSSNDDSMDDMGDSSTVNVEKNTVTSTNTTGNLNYFTISDTGSYFQFSISENAPDLQNPSFGVKVDLMLKELPTKTTTLNHRVEADFNLNTGEYFLNTVDFKTEKWHVPFINSRPTTQLKINVENNVATFTIEDIELSDNFVAPITKTDNITISFSIPTAELNTNSNVFRSLAN